MSDDLKMYQENILDHYKHPRNSGEIHGAQHAHLSNPLCGDEVDYYLTFDDQDKVKAAKFIGRGCTIAVASSSLLTEKLHGMKREDVARLGADDIVAMLGVPINPARMKCATLGLDAVRIALLSAASS